MITYDDKKTIGLAAPWTTYYKMLKVLLEGDPAVKVRFDPNLREIRIFVADDQEKAEALRDILPPVRVFGNIEIDIIVVYPNEDEVLDVSKIDLVEKAFKGNQNIAYIKKVQGVFNNPINYVVCKNKVVQFFNDDMSDLHGMCSTLYQDIAKEVIGEDEGVFFCTEVKDPMPEDDQNQQG